MLARTTAGSKRSTALPSTMTPPAPTASALRRIVPRLPGERMELTAIQLQPSRGSAASSGVQCWRAIAPMPEAPIQAFVQIRYRHAAARATVTPLPGGRAGIAFETSQAAVTPGQVAVFYDPESGEEVFGGGWIEGARAT